MQIRSEREITANCEKTDFLDTSHHGMEKATDSQRTDPLLVAVVTKRNLNF